MEHKFKNTTDLDYWTTICDEIISTMDDRIVDITKRAEASIEWVNTSNFMDGIRHTGHTGMVQGTGKFCEISKNGEIVYFVDKTDSTKYDTTKYEDGALDTYIDDEIHFINKDGCFEVLYPKDCYELAFYYDKTLGMTIDFDDSYITVDYFKYNITINKYNNKLYQLHNVEGAALVEKTSHGVDYRYYYNGTPYTDWIKQKGWVAPFTSKQQYEIELKFS